MFSSVAIYFVDTAEEAEEVPRRQLRDISNVLDMPTNQFVDNFRVTKEIFSNILKELDDKWRNNSRSTSIRPNTKLATFMRFVATGSYQQTVGNEFLSSTSKATVCNIISECLDLFEDHICPQWIKMPLPAEEDTIKQAFFEKHGFPGIIGCVDGTHIRIKAPGIEEKYLFYNRKGYYSINAMVICDHNMTIMAVDARYPGSNHDSFIWEHSGTNRKMQREFRNGKVNTWILGDGGYKLLPYLMTPFRTPSTTFERRYNKKHISARNVVERCFGVLKNRFRCLIGSRGLHYEPIKATKIINACCSLHNMCIKYNCVGEPIELPDVGEGRIEDIVDVMDSRAASIRNKIAMHL